MNNLLEVIYLITALLLILGVRNMSSPKTAKRGFIFSGFGMLIAIIGTLIVFFGNNWANLEWLLLMLALGTIIAWYSGVKVKMIQMPQMIAIYNGMGGGAAAIIGALELFSTSPKPLMVRSLALLGGAIGALSFSGSMIAFAKLQDILKRTIVLPGHNLINILILITGVAFGIYFLVLPNNLYLLLFFILFLTLGKTSTISTGGANMPVVISLFNAMTGLAVAFNGFVLNNMALIIAGTIVGASGTLLTHLMAKAMNKNVSTIIFPSKTVIKEEHSDTTGSLKQMDFFDAATLLAYAKKVIIVPGYGMAVSQAQFKIKELTQLLTAKGVTVKFGIHPVAGRMPGHMNVLLAEADISYDKIFDLDEINSEFSTTDLVLVIGANDVVNPDARTKSGSPIYGMPILNVDYAKNVLVIKRGTGKGFSGIENSLFTLDNVYMLYGNAQDVVNKLVHEVKEI